MSSTVGLVGLKNLEPVIIVGIKISFVFIIIGLFYGFLLYYFIYRNKNSKRKILRCHFCGNKMEEGYNGWSCYDCKGGVING